MTDPVELKQLEDEIRRLEQEMAAEKQSVHRTNRTSLGFAALLAAILLCFLLVNFIKVRAELTPEKFGKSLEKELRELTPEAMHEMRQLGKSLLPVYVAEWKRQIQEAWPEISETLSREVRHLGDNLQSRLHRVLSESEARVLAKTESAVLQQYPHLKDPREREQLERRLHGICNESLHKAVTDFDKLFSKDVEELQSTVFQFDIADGLDDNVDLQKKFLHLWLQLLDQEIMKI